jgi:Protein of unknown function (DUF2384)
VLKAIGRVLQNLGIDDDEARRILGLPDGCKRAALDDVPEATLKRIRHLVAIHEALSGLCGGDSASARSWVRSRNSALGLRTPIELMISGREEDLEHVRRCLGSRRRA